jgi:hypothetical protein
MTSAYECEHGEDLVIIDTNGDPTRQSYMSVLIIGSSLSTLEAIAVVVGAPVAVGMLFLAWRSNRRDKKRLRQEAEARQREREARLSAEYVKGPTGPDEGPYDYRFRLTNTGAVAHDPRGWLVDDTGTTVSDVANVGPGLIHANPPIEFGVTARTLERRLKLLVEWIDETGHHEQASDVVVPMSEAEAASTWRVPPSESGEHPNRS